MKAMFCTQYGPPEVLQMAEVGKPEPKQGEVRVRIRATTVSAADYRIRGLNVPTGFGVLMRLMMGIKGPRRKILGVEFAGEIDAVGKDVTEFSPGDKVFAMNGFGSGSYAEYVCMPADGTIARMPVNLEFKQAAAIPFGGHTALSFLRDKGNLKRGQRILINGASGSVGTAAVQISKLIGAEVTAVCSTRNVKLVKSLGADHVIDYLERPLEMVRGPYDVIFDTVGKMPIKLSKKLLVNGGTFLTAVAGIPEYLNMFLNSCVSSKCFVGGVASESKDDLHFLKELVEQEKLLPIVDRQYTLADIAEAHAYAELGHKTGAVVVLV